MLIGIHVEGNDWMIVRTLLAKLMSLDEAAIEVDRVEHPGMGWQAVLEQAPKTLARFYAKCCAMAVLGSDNDGNTDLQVTGQPEDPRHPRHWNHAGSPAAGECRFCHLESVAQAARPRLNWIQSKPGTSWPIVICVPVEAIESWLLIARAVAGTSGGSLHAERERRTGQKQLVYGRPVATREDVENIALPLLRSLPAAQVNQVRTHSKSFDQFAQQVALVPATASDPCWP